MHIKNTVLAMLLLSLSLLLTLGMPVAGASAPQFHHAAGEAALQDAPPAPCSGGDCTPAPTSTPDTRWIYGKVVDQEGAPVSGAVVRLYRSAGAGWSQIREMTTGSDGAFGFGISPALSGYRLTESDPTGYTSVSALLPSGVNGSVVNASMIDFYLPDQVSVGAFTFVDTRVVEEVTPTPLPIPSSTPTSDAKWVFGMVVNAETGEGLEGAVVRLYRSAGAGWSQIREMTTGEDGAFGFGISPATSAYLLTEQDPTGFLSLSAMLPTGIDGTVVDVNSIRFELPGGPGVGKFIFTDIRESCLITPAPTDTPTSVPTVPSSTPTGVPTVPSSTPTGVPTAPSPTPTDVNTPVPSATPTDAPTSTPAPTDTPAPTPTNTMVPTPTNTPPPLVTPEIEEVCYWSMPGIDLIYRVDPSEFRGYDGDVASTSTLKIITSPPAPAGWNQPGFVPDSSWKPAPEVWWDAWKAFFHDTQPPAHSLVGWRKSDGRQEGLDGVTHLLRSFVTLTPPKPGMHITSVLLEGWSDNKAAWWWDGQLVKSQCEGYNGSVELYPAYVRPEGGTYLLAAQNSNDYQRIENPQGIAFRVCVTWSTAPITAQQKVDLQFPLFTR